ARRCRPSSHRRPRGGCRPGRLGGGRLGGPLRAGRRPRRRGRLPPRQGLRRRAHAACHRRTGRAGPGGLGARARPQPRSPGRRVRPPVGAALAGRAVPRSRQRGPAHRAGRADPAGRPGLWCRAPGPGAGGRRRARRGPGVRSRVRAGRRHPRHRRLPAPRRGRRGALSAGSGAGPRVAPGHRLRRRGAQLPPFRAQPRRVDLLAPGAARHRGRAAVRVRLGLPAGPRRGRGEPRRGDPGHRPPAGRGAAQVVAGVLRRDPPRGVGAGRPGPRRLLRAAAHGRRRVRSGRPQLGPDRRRRRLREPAQRRGHRLRARDRARDRRTAGRGRLVDRLARHAAPALRRGVLHRPAPGGPADRAALPARGRPGRHAVPGADDRGAAGDGQPGERGGPRRRRPGLARGRKAVGHGRRPATVPGRRPPRL
ncbi:MAG: Putative oxidoreductase, partial [uncultured Blastococcus sp.]